MNETGRKRRPLEEFDIKDCREIRKGCCTPSNNKECLPNDIGKGSRVWCKRVCIKNGKNDFVASFYHYLFEETTEDSVRLNDSSSTLDFFLFDSNFHFFIALDRIRYWAHFLSSFVIKYLSQASGCVVSHLSGAAAACVHMQRRDERNFWTHSRQHHRKMKKTQLLIWFYLGTVDISFFFLQVLSSFNEHRWTVDFRFFMKIIFFIFIRSISRRESVQSRKRCEADFSVH